ncbi:MAG TPA: hypothetical protein P5050_00050 [Bacteroidia bacterium]|nr:hypothetical protein [Sphingobacteriales bacterium]HPD64049.1 hypothetical protein [Bacteroidia bacterium]HRS57590.1 hypothetical protein [Bacteroidia bacterium]HRU67176.1 hypothetical protein [Bacteroidia bacterium]
MKRLVYTLVALFMISNLFAQTTTPPKTPPKTPPPQYVLKKDYDASMAEMSEKLSRISGQIGALSARVNAKDNNFDALKANIDTLTKVLQSMNIKVSLTSDSLSNTIFTVSDLRKKVDDDLEVVRGSVTMVKGMVLLAFAGLAVLLVLEIILFFILNKKISKLAYLEETVNEALESAKEDFGKMKSEIKPMITKEVQLSQASLDSRINRTRVELIDMIALTKNQLTKITEELGTQLDQLIRNTGNKI